MVWRITQLCKEGWMFQAKRCKVLLRQDVHARAVNEADSCASSKWADSMTKIAGARLSWRKGCVCLCPHACGHGRRPAGDAISHKLLTTAGANA